MWLVEKDTNIKDVNGFINLNDKNMDIKEEVIWELEKNSIESLETLSEWWLEYEYSDNLWENEKEYENRKNMVIPLIIDEKLKRHELEYDSK